MSYQRTLAAAPGSGTSVLLSGDQQVAGVKQFTGAVVLGSPSYTAANRPAGTLFTLASLAPFSSSGGDHVANLFQALITGDWTNDQSVDPGFAWGTNFFSATGSGSGDANGAKKLYGGLIEFDVRAGAGSHIQDVIGLQAEASFATASSAALVDSITSLLVAAPVRKDGATAGTATTVYGLYIQDVEAANVGATNAYALFVAGGPSRIQGPTSIVLSNDAIPLTIKGAPNPTTNMVELRDALNNLIARFDQFGQMASSNNVVSYEGQAGSTTIGRIGPSTGASKESGIAFSTAFDARIYRKSAGVLSINSGKITDHATPTASADVATKGYVDSQATAGTRLALTSYNPGSNTTLTTAATTFGDVDATNAVATFTAPASGAVTVRVSALIRNQTAANTVKLNLRSGSSDVAGTGQSMTADAVAQRLSYAADVTGLTPGASVTWKLGWRVTGGTGEISCGGTDLGPLRIEIAAA